MAARKRKGSNWYGTKKRGKPGSNWYGTKRRGRKKK